MGVTWPWTCHVQPCHYTLGDSVTDWEQFETSYNTIDFLGNQGLAKLLVPDKVVMLRQLRHIAMVSLKSFI